MVPRLVCGLACAQADKGLRSDITFYGEEGPLGLAAHGIWTDHYQKALMKSF